MELVKKSGIKARKAKREARKRMKLILSWKEMMAKSLGLK